MKAATRTILTSRVEFEKKLHTHPIAVFPNEPAAKAYATELHIAISKGDAAKVKELDERIVLDASGAIVTGVKFSVVSVPYDPTISNVDDSIFV
jgi:hypothetical protein